MKKIFFCLTFILTMTTYAVAQVGINTKNPQGIFHFDGKGDTDVNSNTNTSDDIVFSRDGKLGIGTISPTESVHVEGKSKTSGNLQTGSISLEDGSKGLIQGKVGLAANDPSSDDISLQIVSPTATIKIEDPGFKENQFVSTDSLGNASWSYLRPSYKLAGYDIANGKPQPLYNTAGKDINNSNGQFFDITDNPLILDKGKWLIICKYTSEGNIGGAGMLLWNALRAKPTSVPTGTGVGETFFDKSAEIVRYGFRPESAGLIGTTPSFSAIVTVVEPTEYRVFANISTDARFFTSNLFGGSFFTAIRLDDK